MLDTYNLYNLEAPFKQFLLSGIAQSRTEPDSIGSGTGTKKQMTPVSVKNYLSDIRHFFGWMTFYIKSNDKGGHGGPPLQELITANTISEYKSYLTSNNIPHKTVNRRLSTVRKFCSFCISQGWLKENPAKKVGNIGGISPPSLELRRVKEVGDGLLEQFQSDLEKEKLDQSVITSYLSDVREFLGLL